MAVIEDLGIEALKWGMTELEIRYREGAEPLEWDRDQEEQILLALGLRPAAWRLGAGRLVRASDGSLTEIVDLRPAGGDE